MILIDIFSDPICPWCFIGKQRLDLALAARPEITATIRWRAFQLNPEMPIDGMERQRYLSAKFGGADRAAEIYDHIAHIGATLGIRFQFERIKRTPSTLQAHRLIRFAQRAENGKGAAIVPILFRRYFLDGQDLGSEDTLLDAAEEAGLNRPVTSAYLASNDDVGEVKSEDMMARQLGIGGVPFFIIQGKYALSGAQEPEGFNPLFDIALKETGMSGHTGGDIDGAATIADRK